MMAAKTRDLFIFKDFSELTKQFPEIALAASHQDSKHKAFDLFLLEREIIQGVFPPPRVNPLATP